MNKVAIAGSFDPFHKGHEFLVEEALNLFEEIYIIVCNNKAKKHMIPIQQRMYFIEYFYRTFFNCNREYNNRIKIVSLPDDKLLFSYMEELNINYYLRGIRNTIDFEYEKQLKSVNESFSNIKTLFTIFPSNLESISSSSIKELFKYSEGYELIKNNHWISACLIDEYYRVYKK